MNWHKSVFPTAPIISIVIIAGCSQFAPKNADIKTSLQGAVPPYLEVTSLSIDNRENLGTRTNPVIQSRFKAALKLKEDTFTSAERLDSVDWERQRDITFINLVEKNGKTLEIYGFAVSQPFMDSWKTELQFDNNPFSELGEPRSYFQGKTVLRNSPEEEEFLAEVKKQIESEKEALEKAIIGEWYGSAFNSSNSRLTIKRENSDLNVILIHEGYREVMKLELLPQNKIVLNGISVTKLDGSRADGYYLDTFELTLNSTGDILKGEAIDKNRSRGYVKMQKVNPNGTSVR